MKRWFLVSVFLVSGAVVARTLNLSRLPSPECADTEVSTSRTLDFAPLQTGDFRFSLAFDATPTNNVELSFGSDADGNGRLSADEERLTFGWDCGEWVLKGRRGEESAIACERMPEGPSAGGARKCVDWCLSIRHGRPLGLVLTANGQPLFPGLATNPPAWFCSRDWNGVKVTARGVDAPDELARVKLRVNGTRLLWR